MSMALANAAAPAPTSLPWDEMATGRGGLRPGWGSLLATASALGTDGLGRRADLLDRMLAEDGVTGLLPGLAPSTWRCDPVPLLLGAAEFAALEAGLAQRAHLIETVLRDIYGKQSLLAEGLLPPGLIYANPTFLRPCCDRDATGQRLSLYAAELLRGPDGAWRVIADRTDDAAGIAYVIENRRALYRAVPELFRSHPPRSLQPFIDAWQAALHLLPHGTAPAPTLALLTPGADDKLWFEHVVLARELSCTLVESNDLTVRDGALFLKTLRGLQQVHVLLRRQDGRTLDPLELEPTARLGVTGLLDAARAGSVRILNDPGTGCMEAPLWAAVLPTLAPRLLGEPLLLPGAETLWLGDAGSRARVAAEPRAWRIRSALDGKASALAPHYADPAALQACIDADPAGFVAVRKMAPSHAPCLATDGLQPRPVQLRMFLIFDGETWRALPGGFARVVSQQDLECGRLPLHALCKDVWVATEEAEDIVGRHLPPPRAFPVRHASGELPSRVADNFFWLGRTLERLEAAARLLRAALTRVERPNPSPREAAELRSVVTCLVTANLLDREAVSGLGASGLVEHLLQVGRSGATLPTQLNEISRLAEGLRDRLTREVYATVMQGLRTLGQALNELRPPDDTSAASQLHDLDGACAAILSFSATVAGLAAENMVRSGGRLFLDLGRRVERAWVTARIVAQALDQSPGPLEPGLRLALEFCDSAITYRSRYLTALQASLVLDLVLTDEGNPRALAFQLSAIRDVLAELARAPAASLPLQASGLLREVRDIARVAAETPEHQTTVTVPALLRTVERGVAALSAGIERQYFAVLPSAHLIDDDMLPQDSRARHGLA